METEFTKDWQGFKEMASEFLLRMKKPTTTLQQIEGGLKAINLAFIYMTGTDLERYQSEILLNIVHREVDNRLSA